MESASKALSASLYRSSVSMIDVCFRSSVSAAIRSLYAIDARTRGFDEVAETYSGYATAEKFGGSRYNV